MNNSNDLRGLNIEQIESVNIPIEKLGENYR